MKQQKEFITPDIWLASALSIILDITPDYKLLNHKILFVFPGDDNTYRAIAAYSSGCSLPAYQYAETVKKLKVEMLTRRDKGGQ